MRQAIRELGLVPDLVLVSPARRTLQTLEALEPWDETPLVEPTEALYLGTATQLLTVLHGVPDVVRSVLLIGHNPGLHELAVMLAGPPAKAPVPQGRPPHGRGISHRRPGGIHHSRALVGAGTGRRPADAVPDAARGRSGAMS